MAEDWWKAAPLVSAAPRQPGVVGHIPGRPEAPRQPPPQTATNAALDDERLGDVTFENTSGLRKEFNSLPEVKRYTGALPTIMRGFSAPDDAQGDLSIIYGFATAMDPESVVRGEEMTMAQATASIPDQWKAAVGQLTEGKRLPPDVRAGLLRTMRTAGDKLNTAYIGARSRYADVAQRRGFDPVEIVGEHSGLGFQQDEANWKGKPIINRNGSVGASPQVRGVDPITPSTIVDRLVGEGPLQVDVTDERLPGETDEAYEARINAGIAAEVPAAVAGQRGQGGVMETIDAGVRGAADTLTLGSSDELAAALSTLFKGGTMRQNLANERGVDAYDAENHFGARLTGQLAGGLALPTFGVSSVRGMAGVGAGYGGAYGFNSGQGGVGDRTVNALTGAVAGGAVGAGLGAAIPAITRGASALGRRHVGPSNARQNALLDAGTAEGVPVNMTDLYPGSLNTAATLETIPGASGVIREGIGAGRDAIEGRVQTLARGGTAREDMGQVVQDAGRRFVERADSQAGRNYDRARRLAGDTPVQPQSVMQALSELTRREAATPGGTRAGAVIQQYADAFENGGEITIDGARRMRSELLSRLRDDGGLSKKEATRVTGLIMRGVSDDIERSLTQAGRAPAVAAYRFADRFYAQSRDDIENVIERFIGTDDKPKSVEQTLSLMQAAAGTKGNSAGHGRMLAALSPDERRDYAATLVEPLGRASADEPFSPSTFISNVRKISPTARRTVFGADGERSIQNLVRLSNAKKQTVQRLNNSRSGQVGNYRTVLSSILFGVPGGGAVLGAATGLNMATGAVGAGAIAGVGLGASRGIARALMSENFTRLLAQAPATANPAAINNHIGRMRALAAKDPNVRGVVEQIEQSMLRAVNDNAQRTTQAVASDSREKENNR